MTVAPAPPAGDSPVQLPLLPKLRGNFAEFLNEGSLARLRILSSPTCVGLRYGYLIHSLEDFLGSRHQPLRPRRSLGSPSLLGVMFQRICLPEPPTSLDLDFQHQAGSVLASYVPPSVWSKRPCEFGSTGILTRYPSASPFGYALGAD